MKEKITASPLANVLLFSAFWAIQVFISKLAFNAGAPVMPFTVQSLIFSIVILISYILLFKRQALFQIPAAIIGGLVIASAIHGGIGGFLSNVGVSLTSAINAGFLLQFTTVTTGLLAWILLKEKMTPSKAVTMVMIVVGTYLLVTNGHLDAFHIGDIILICACLAWSTGNVLTRGILKSNKLDADVVSLFRPLAGLPLVLLTALVAPSLPITVQPAFSGNIFSQAYLGFAFLNGLFAVLIWIFLNRTLQIASASYMTMMSSLTPVLVALMALIFLGESLAPIQWIGVVVIILSGYTTFMLKIDKH